MKAAKVTNQQFAVSDNAWAGRVNVDPIRGGGEVKSSSARSGKTTATFIVTSCCSTTARRGTRSRLI